MILSMSYSLNFRIPNPMLTGSANIAAAVTSSTSCQMPVALFSQTLITVPTMKTAAPLGSL